MQYYLDTDKTLVYTRWDTWLIYKGYVKECVAMILKSDAQVSDILGLAREKAREIQSSKLTGVLG